MLTCIGLAQLSVFTFFFTLERCFPAYQHPVPPRFGLWWICLGLFALVWLRALVYLWVEIPGGMLDLDIPLLAEVFVFYLIYSLGNYWFHRIKHRNRFLWRYVHSFHHSTSQMETRVAFYRHPTEILANTLYLLLLGKIVFGVSAEVLLIALAIEGCLESFHHSNISIPSRLSWLGYLFQLPSMHLVHHQYGLHRFNYAPLLWDTVFGTVKIPENWNQRLGLAKSHDITSLFLLR